MPDKVLSAEEIAEIKRMLENDLWDGLEKRYARRLIATLAAKDSLIAWKDEVIKYIEKGNVQLKCWLTDKDATIKELVDAGEKARTRVIMLTAQAQAFGEWDAAVLKAKKEGRDEAHRE